MKPLISYKEREIRFIIRNLYRDAKLSYYNTVIRPFFFILDWQTERKILRIIYGPKKQKKDIEIDKTERFTKNQTISDWLLGKED